jgi:predicted Zn-dependent protease
MSGLMSETDVRALLDRALAAALSAGAQSARANVSGGERTNMRFARNGITTNGSTRGVSLSLSVSVGKKTAEIETNRADDEEIARVAKRAVENARVLPDDPEHMPPLGAQRYAAVNAWFDEPGALDPAAVAARAGRVTRAAASRDVVTAGIADSERGFRAIASTNGLFAFHRTTSARLTATTRTRDGTGSGWATSYSRRPSAVDADAVADGSIWRAITSRGPVAEEPGEWPVILEPQATANILNALRWSLDARSADEGRSFFAKEGGGNRIGERIWNTPLSVRSDPSHELTLGTPFNGEGLPVEPTTWVDDGVVRNLAYSRYWAQKQGRQPLASARGMVVEGRGHPMTLKEMIASERRAILVTRLWYIRMVDPKQILLTGLTRDGTFLVENGEITKALKNFRFNESPIEVMRRAQLFSAPVAVGQGTAVPALRVGRFRFSSISEAV